MIRKTLLVISVTLLMETMRAGARPIHRREPRVRGRSATL